MYHYISLQVMKLFAANCLLPLTDTSFALWFTGRCDSVHIWKTYVYTQHLHTHAHKYAHIVYNILVSWCFVTVTAFYWKWLFRSTDIWEKAERWWSVILNAVIIKLIISVSAISPVSWKLMRERSGCERVCVTTKGTQHICHHHSDSWAAAAAQFCVEGLCMFD